MQLKYPTTENGTAKRDIEISERMKKRKSRNVGFKKTTNLISLSREYENEELRKNQRRRPKFLSRNLRHREKKKRRKERDWRVEKSKE